MAEIIKIGFFFTRKNRCTKKRDKETNRERERERAREREREREKRIETNHLGRKRGKSTWRKKEKNFI